MRDIRTRTLLDRATAWAPVLLLGALAALTYWLDSQVQAPAPRRDGSTRHDPDIYIERFRAVELDAKGRPKQAVSGKRAMHFGDDQTTEVIEPMLSQTEAGKPAFRVSASKGRSRATARTCTSRATCVRCATPGRPSRAKARPAR